MKPLNLFVPGRICLFGEHSDWAGGHRRTNANIAKGHAIIVGTNQGIYAKVSPHSNKLEITSTKPDGKKLSYSIPMEPEVLKLEASKGGFWSYIAGVAYQASKQFDVGGLHIDNYKTDLPVQKGLSSSAAISVLTARAFNLSYNLQLSTNQEMELAYQGEITTPSRCGRMDQGCAYGNQPILMTFDADQLAVQPLTLGRDIYLVIIDLHGHKDTKKILSDLNAAYPFAQNQREKNLHKLLGKTNQRIIKQAIQALQRGNAEQLGKLMSEAQQLFDQYAQPLCPEELTAPKLHQLLVDKKLQPYVFGGKGVGSQGDGTAQLIAKNKQDQQTLLQIITAELKLPALPLTISA